MTNHDSSPPPPGKPSGANPNAFALGAAKFFFPQSKSLGLDRTQYSPTVLQRITYAGANNTSFRQAADMLQHLAALTVNAKQVERLTERIGRERVAERDAAKDDYFTRPLPERKDRPDGVLAPPVATIQMDGGRLQIMARATTAATTTDDSTDRDADAPILLPLGLPTAPDAADMEEENVVPPREKSKYWREDKIGVLLSMTSPTHDVDPCPVLPDTFLDPLKILRLVRELKPVTGATEAAAHDAPTPDDDEASNVHEPPTIRVRTVLATRGTIDEFAPLLATAAWERGFYAAERRAFVADGSSCNWTTWQKHFSSFEPILDFVHALTYVFGAATVGRDFDTGWSAYAEWLPWLWSGEVERVIAAVRDRTTALGPLPETDVAGSPRLVLQRTLKYLTNHASKMDYARYRKAGLPLTSTHVESTIKLINQRVKGTEKLWSEEGAEELLQLRADYLCDTEPMEKFWERRAENATGFHRNSRAA